MCNEQHCKIISKLLLSAVELSHSGAATGIADGDRRRQQHKQRANATINILSTTASCKEYICSSQFIGDSVTTLPQSAGRG